MAQAGDLKEPLASYSVYVLHSDKKQSFVWKYFGKLTLTRDGKRKHIYTKKIFCKPCVGDADKKGATEEDDFPDDPNPESACKYICPFTIARQAEAETEKVKSVTVGGEVQADLSNMVAVIGFELEIKVRDLSTLQPEQWLNDVVDIFSFRTLMVPICQSDHWTLIVVDMPSKTMSYFDSMNGNGIPECMHVVLNYLRDELLAKKQQILEINKWSLERKKDIPCQTHFVDCGVFLLKHALCIALGEPFNFTQTSLSSENKSTVKSSPRTCSLCDVIVKENVRRRHSELPML
ncbi:hypothetical protein FOCC_FOCC014946 [Frankliniella occidentalis]|uniref:Uncharacterized protein LOC127751085 n=1 Tax=Frankliniella occidentalis TaxID=133901 RepID=A0A9C6X6H8_FRAOC|nr:uncharacterized protein LOC127751085 [Frankliniella occidentalis]KAE8739563.1 hypothetical protein FOCC_FOCC014946 [Frankliniella occidentalis]